MKLFVSPAASDTSSDAVATGFLAITVTLSVWTAGVAAFSVLAWTGDGGGSPNAMVVENYYSNERRSEVVRARFDIEVKTVDSDLIEILSNITTA
jgi:hypothetical protein